MRLLLRPALTTCLLLMPLAGCALPGFLTPPPQVRGNHVDADQLKELVPGTTTRADVTSLLGSPTTKAPFDDNTWVYVSEVTRPVIGGTQGVLSQEAVEIHFDDKGVLTGVTRKTKADSEPVSVVARTTPSPGSNPTFLQQLLGNVGRFNAGAPAASSNPNRSNSPN
ncbi:MAG: outer membrane protein assembly factor BamE [Rhodospirillales bacterium]|nr:outer membrane protein assembly factor BamE [Rhodospirillales bacterium]